MTVVLAVGLDDGCLELLTSAMERRDEATLVAHPDAQSARDWPRRGDAAPRLIVAAFHEADAWGLSALLAGVCSRGASGSPDVLLLTDVPGAALPVLITDVAGLRTVAAGSTEDLRAHLEGVLSSWSVLAAG